MKLQVSPQSIPVRSDVTTPPPVGVTVNIGVSSNAAVTVFEALISTVQASEPVQAPPQPVKV